MGQSPSIVRQPGGRLIMCACDTSYSDMTASKSDNPANNRGKAASIVRLDKDSVRVEGVLADGRQHGFTMHTDQLSDRIPDAMVGRQLKDESWVKTVTIEDSQLQCVTVKGFAVKDEALEPSAAIEQCKSDY